MTKFRICRQIPTRAGVRLADVSLSFTDALTIVAPNADVAIQRANKLVADTRGLVAVPEGN